MVLFVNKKVKLKVNDFLERLRINLNMSESVFQSNLGIEKLSKFERKLVIILGKEVKILLNFNNIGFKYGIKVLLRFSLKDIGLDIVFFMFKVFILKFVLEMESFSIISVIMERKDKIIIVSDGKILDIVDYVKNILLIFLLQKGKIVDERESEVKDKIELIFVVVVIDSDDNIVEEDLFLEENLRLFIKDIVSQYNDEYGIEYDI